MRQRPLIAYECIGKNYDPPVQELAVTGDSTDLHLGLAEMPQIRQEG